VKEGDFLRLVSAALLIAFHFNEFPSQLSPDFLAARWRPVLRLTALHVFSDLFLCGIHWLNHLPPPWMQHYGHQVATDPWRRHQ
jgi:hypothetical protein